MKEQFVHILVGVSLSVSVLMLKALIDKRKECAVTLTVINGFHGMCSYLNKTFLLLQ
jgi:hypothetical protein